MSATDTAPARPNRVPVSLMRGGTSRGIVLPLEAVPPAGPDRDQFLISLMGSTDPGQINGFGGNSSVTSKVMMVSHQGGPGPIDYLFAQVDPRNPVVDYGGNCGNMTAAVALYAALEGLTPTASPTTDVLLRNLNTSTLVRARVPSDGTRPATAGDYRMPGMSRPGPEIVTEYLEPAGVNGMLPTGHATQDLVVPGVGTISVSVVDVASPLVFVRAEHVGLAGTELPQDIDADSELLGRLEAIRGVAAHRLGLVTRPRDAARQSPGIPKLTIVASPLAYTSVTGQPTAAEDSDILVRMMSVQRAHPAIAITGTICTAAAAQVPGTIPHSVARGDAAAHFRVGHPRGVAVAAVETAGAGASIEIRKAAVSRTARRLLRGETDPMA